MRPAGGQKKRRALTNVSGLARKTFTFGRNGRTRLAVTDGLWRTACDDGRAQEGLEKGDTDRLSAVLVRALFHHATSSALPSVHPPQLLAFRVDILRALTLAVVGRPPFVNVFLF